MVFVMSVEDLKMGVLAFAAAAIMIILIFAHIANSAIISADVLSTVFLVYLLVATKPIAHAIQELRRKPFGFGKMRGHILIVPDDREYEIIFK